MGKKEIKIGVREGHGPPPGYQWNVAIIDLAFDEVISFLTPGQYEHMAMQVKELAREEDPTHSRTTSVGKIDEYYELREKGGILGKKNVRVFFGVDKSRQAIVILGGMKKENDGQTPSGTKIVMRRRWRKYVNGDYGEFDT